MDDSGCIVVHCIAVPLYSGCAEDDGGGYVVYV